MYIVDMRPRYLSITANLQRKEVERVKRNICIDSIPKDITMITGDIHHLRTLEEGMCNTAIRLHAENGEFALKISSGEYRKQELAMEHRVMRELRRSDRSIPMAHSYILYEEDNLSYQVQEYISGKTFSEILEQPNNLELKLKLFCEIGIHLATIHKVCVPHFNWNDWINAQLAIAEKNYIGEVLDLEEFAGIDLPDNILQWLYENKPDPTEVCLLHGDYRPKNILCNHEKITAIIDWGFCDIGDPFYDLSIISYYLQTKEFKRAFFEGYGLSEEECKERIYYYDLLSKFINV